MYLAITLSRLDDFGNACSAYEKAIENESDHLFHLNYAITLFNHADNSGEAKRQFQLFERLFAQLDDDTKTSDPDILEQQELLKYLLS